MTTDAAEATDEALRPGVHIDGEDRDRIGADLAKRYAEGESIRMLARSIGRSYGFTQRILVEQGVVFRSRGGAHPAPIADPPAPGH